MNDFDVFAKNIVTSQDALRVIDELQVVKNLIFRPGEGSLTAKIKGKVSAETERAFQTLEAAGKLPLDSSELDKLLDSIQEWLRNLPSVKLSISFSPNREFLERVSAWFEKELGGRIVLDIKLTPEIIGGLIIEYKGKYRDYSVSKKIDEILAARSGSTKGLEPKAQVDQPSSL